jgi:hypothetical protein
MSGRKYTQVELASQVHEALRCRDEAAAALAAAVGLAAALGDASRETAFLRGAASAASRALEAIRGQMDSIAADFNEARLMQLDLNDVRSRRARVEGLRRELGAIAEACTAGCEAAGVRAQILAIRAQALHRRDDLRPWVEAEFDRFVASADDLLTGLDEEVRATGAAGRAGSLAGDLASALASLAGGVDERRCMDADRRYVADALLAVCRDELGFGGCLLPLARPVDDLVLEVDTFAYGVIHFRLGLDGVVRSQSESVAACPSNYARLEERLRKAGVFASFRYEADQRPVVIEKGSKDLPADDGGESISMER